MKQKNRILIVEDERIPAEFLKGYLEQNGYEVIAICDKGQDAIKIAKDEKPDVIFMDIILKDHISGSEAALKISSSIDTKIIFLTAHSDDEMIEYALDAGAINYLIKPYKEKQILAALQIALNHNNRAKIDDQVVHLKCGYTYNTHNHKLFLHDEEVDLGKKSMLLIDYLCKHINTRLSNAQIIYHVYGEEKESSTLRTLIYRINKTLMCDLIQNSSRLGYKILSEK